MRLIAINTAKDLNPFLSHQLYADFDPDSLIQQGPDAHWLVVDNNDNALARCSLWWQQVPTYQTEHLGVIGHFAAENSAAAQSVLQQACQQLKQQGCSMAVGPMDGNTWRRYRLISQCGDEPPFFLEPNNPDSYPVYFLENGFAVMAEYSSALNSDLTIEDDRIKQFRQQTQQQGIQLRPLSMEAFEEELTDIYELSLASFQDNFLYTPIAQAEFFSLYARIKPYVRPELTLLAEQNNQLIGYLFGLPDLAQAERGQTIDTLIIKTVAVSPKHRSAGLGALLVAEAQRRAHDLGYCRAIHALMHHTNNSRQISHHCATTMRQYALYQRIL